ncbi:MAG TPA: YfhO family protein [Candidatus Brocadiia bacterium]|nr:YfhO family protein [Candidatus Brocadiia bacterium]
MSGGERNGDDSRPRWGFALLAFALGCAFFCKVVFLNHVFFIRDFGCFLYPAMEFAAQCIRQGEFPTWYPDNACGVPILATWNMMILYPPFWFYWLAPCPTTLGLIYAAHCAFAAWGTWLMLRRWGVSRPGAAFGAFGFSFGGTYLSGVEYTSPLCTMTWVPWLLILTDRLIEQPTRGRFALLCCGWGWTLLAGQPEITFYSGILVGAYAVCASGLFEPKKSNESVIVTGFQERGKRPIIKLMVFGLTPLIGACLAAVQILPSLELIPYSVRPHLDDASGNLWAFTLQDIARVMNAEFFARPGPDWEIGGYLQRYVWSPYSGAMVAGFAASALITGSWRARFFCAGFFLFAILALGGDFILWRMMKMLPGAGIFRFPAKAFEPAAFALPVAAAFGFDLLTVGIEQRTRPASGAGLFVAPLIAVVSIILGIAAIRDHLAGGSARMIRAFAPGCIALISWSIALIASRKPAGHAGTTGHHLQKLIVVLLVFDMAVQNFRLNPTIPLASLKENARRLREQTPDAQRIAFSFRDASKLITATAETPERMAQWMNLSGMRWRNQPAGRVSATGFGPSAPLMSYFNVLDFTVSDGPEPPGAEKLFSFLGVTHRIRLKTDPEGRPLSLEIDTLKGALARALIVPRGRRMTDDEALKAMHAGDWDPASEALVSAALPAEAASWTGSDIKAMRLSPTRLSFETEGGGGILVLSDIWYPGWATRIDGRETETLRLNYAFRGCLVPPGSHNIEMTYRPRSLSTGLLITGGMLAALAIFSLFPCLSKRCDGPSV